MNTAKSLFLPHSREAEEFILGGILLDGAAFDKVDDLLPEHFHWERHRILFEAMLGLREQGVPIDFCTLADATANQAYRVGGAEYITQLCDRIPTSANIEHYSKILKEKSTLRAIIQGAGEMIKVARSPGIESEGALEAAEEIIFGINKDVRHTTGLVPARGHINNFFTKLEKVARGEIVDSAVSTGFHDLDNLFMGGLHSTDLIIIAARPSMGKTSLALNIAEYAAAKERIGTAVFSLEMGEEQLLIKLLASMGGMWQKKLRDPNHMSKDDWGKLVMVCQELYEAPLYMDATPAISPAEMRSKLRRLSTHAEIGLVVVDYLQLMTTRKNYSVRELEIAEISKSLKALAKEFKVPVIALSQLNRRVEERANKRPMMSDLRESGAIEQDADIISFIYREEVYNEDTEHKGLAEIIIAKHRNGPTGDIKLRWRPEVSRFENLETVTNGGGKDGTTALHDMRQES